jgi:chloramphenicol O-acetyltransferase type A
MTRAGANNENDNHSRRPALFAGGKQAMKPLDLENWNRRAAYEFFRDFDDPFFNLTAPLDATVLYRFCRENRLSFALAALFLSLRAANEIREFRIRLVAEQLVEFDRVEATQTILNDDETFSFCYFPLADDIFDFDRTGRAAVEKYRRLKTFEVEAERVDLIYYSVIPWVSFTSFKHASRFDNRQTVPRMVFGKLTEEGGRRLIPHSVEVHHAIADGLHVGKYFNLLQEKFNNP